MSNSTTCFAVGEEFCGFLYGLMVSMAFGLCYSCMRGCAVVRRPPPSITTRQIERSLPKTTVTDATEYESMCPICIENITDEVCKLPCGHYFHPECIYRWLLEKNVCPLCKVKAIEDP